MGFTEGNTSPAVLKAAGGLILFISFLSFIGACVYYNVSEEKIEDSNNDDEMYCDARGRNQTARRLQDAFSLRAASGAFLNNCEAGLLSGLATAQATRDASSSSARPSWASAAASACSSRARASPPTGWARPRSRRAWSRKAARGDDPSEPSFREISPSRLFSWRASETTRLFLPLLIRSMLVTRRYLGAPRAVPPGCFASPVRPAAPEITTSRQVHGQTATAPARLHQNTEAHGAQHRRNSLCVPLNLNWPLAPLET